MKIKYLLKSVFIVTASIAITVTTSCVAPNAGSSISVDPTTGSKVYPVAQPLLDEVGQHRKDLFISPYKPFNPINTKGFKSGDLAGDPSTAETSEKTGKPVLSTSKVFRIP